MANIAVPKSGRARSAARHRERTEARLPTRRLPQSTTRTSGYADRTTVGANETIRAVIRTQGHQLVPFFCECSEAGCGQAIWLALADYDEHARVGDPLLVEGHAC